MKPVIIVGGGYSVKEGIERGLWNEIRRKEIWSCNYAYKSMPYLPQREFWVDYNFFRHNVTDLQLLSSKGVQMYVKKHPKYNAIKKIKQFVGSRNELNKDGIFITKKGLVGCFALSFAIKEEYDPIYLLGYDYGVPKDKINQKKTHYYQDSITVYSTGVKRPEAYLNQDGTPDEFVKEFQYYLKFKSKIYNVSLESNIPYFEKLSWTDFFRRVKNDT